MQAKIHRLAKFKKHTPLHVDYSPYGKLRVRRWASQWGVANDKPNAIAIDDLPAGGVANINESGGLYEVRSAS